MKEAGEYAGAHVLSMVHAHYPLIDLKRLEAGYPKEIDPDKAEELRTAQLDLSSKIIGDINLCGGGTAPVVDAKVDLQTQRANTRIDIQSVPVDLTC